MTGRPRLAVVGAGLIGRRHAELIARAGQLAAVVDPNEATRALAQDLGAVWVPEIGALWGRAELDGAVIATPNQAHADHARAFIEAGLPVLVEKPITDTASSGAALVELAEAAGVPVLVGHHRRHNPLIAAAREAIAAGRLGRITLVNAQFWLYKPEEYYAETWRRRAGAGPVFINLIHDIDLLRHLCGEITAVAARQSSAERGFEVEDTAALLLEFANGALGTVTVSDTTVAPWSWEFASGENPAYPKTEVPCYMIGGTEGALSVPDLSLWSQPRGRGWWNPIASERLGHTPADPLVRQLEHFNAVIAGAAEPLVSGRDALGTLRVVEAVKRAADSGQWQAVPGG